MKKLVYGVYGLGALFALQHAPYVFGQTAAATEPTQKLDSVIVTGTRLIGLKAVDSAAPIQVIDSQTLQRSGQIDVMQALAAVIPSFTAEASGFDTANLTLSARLRGLSPNDALILVNGKRRHTTANLHVDGGFPTSGAAAADLSFIPLSAVDHVEVLLDGAAAQYGTDAIAGVVNIILKRNTSGGSVDVTGGQYYDEGGRTASGAFNIGLEPFKDAYLNVSAEKKYHGFSYRGAVDARLLNPSSLTGVNQNAVNFPLYPNSNRISGDAQYRSDLFGFNSGYDYSEQLQLYSFGTWGTKDALSFENYRMPARIPKIYPNGFNPQEGLGETDYGLTIGAKGQIQGWNWDTSVTHGADYERISTLNSGNASLNGQFVPKNPDGSPGADGYTPTNFHDGNFRTGQTTWNGDLSKDFEVGLSSPLTVAAGLEYRDDFFAIEPGDPLSYFGSGAQSFSGYSPQNSGRYSRNDKSAYIDFIASPIKDLQFDLAGRYEKYSDFGSAKVGKLTARYDINKEFAIRGTYSNGFRAPTLAEEFYSGNNVGPTSFYLQLPPNSAAAKALGVSDLKPEKSNNFSLGFVAHPTDAASVTVDAYQITLKDRIVASGSYRGYYHGEVKNQVVVDALNAANIDPATYSDPATGDGGVSFFTNGAKTRTRGLDVVFTYLSDYAQYGKVDWSISGNYTITKLLDTTLAPAPLFSKDANGNPIPSSILDPIAVSALTTATPKFRINFGGLWKLGAWTVSLRETVFGPSSLQYLSDDDIPDPYYTSKISTKLITDLEVSNEIVKSFTVTIGAKNLFNTYPNKLNPAILNSYIQNGDNANVTQYPVFSPFGINGGYYYARATYKF